MAIINAAYRIFLTGNVVWLVTLPLLFISARFFPDHAGTVATAHLAVLAATWLMLPVMVLAFAVVWFRQWDEARRTGLLQAPSLSLDNDEVPSQAIEESVQRARDLDRLGGTVFGAGATSGILLAILRRTDIYDHFHFWEWIIGYCVCLLLMWLGASLCIRLANSRLVPFKKHMDQVAAQEVENHSRRLQARFAPARPIQCGTA
jgi:hypothetical protein